ncbi:aromatic amino acid transaminase [Taylorella equigenitalis]|uniref:amino acid aminotransferase n=1 Tax=Taylorella equigenitalis TaxID=29575 RepID=UPI00237CB048|nr:amino acid aminotransferase [Taylorella equigenitalis]WDU52745.1 aspartate/tyrosine/aromatic aminotransferase [Taylorella equigenitalis]
MSKLFSNIELAPIDPILGLSDLYRADSNPNKVNLGVGVYYDENGNIPIPKAVKVALERFVQNSKPFSYRAQNGTADYTEAVKKLILGEELYSEKSKVCCTVQSLAGTGALMLAANFLHKITPNSTVYVSNPTWGNHKTIFGLAGFKIDEYPYYNDKIMSLDFDGMTEKLNSLEPKSIIVLHTCCHNPTGVDLNEEQWKKVAEIVKAKNLIPILDTAYQGFAEGLEEDAKAIRIFASEKIETFVTTSFSKIFSLYGERIGALTVICSDESEVEPVLSQIKVLIRSTYSNPTTFGASLVSTILNDKELYEMWKSELESMRQRILKVRKDLVIKIKEAGAKRSFDFIVNQKGMFSYTGLSKEQVQQLKEDKHLYIVSSGRICVSAINDSNIDYVANSIALA